VSDVPQVLQKARQTPGDDACVAAAVPVHAKAAVGTVIQATTGAPVASRHERQ
jgi:hypothetical protein